MKTRTIIFLSKKIDTLVGAMNDYVPSHAHEEMIEYYTKATNIYGQLMYELVYYWIINHELRYDRQAVKRALSPFQWQMFSSIERKYLNIILHGRDRTYKNNMTKEIALELTPSLN
jgi:hypothetical protein